ncbi:hypothetical protein H6P81_004455 [Aristolochia fimbriata]|uniref:Chlororespiratory reduction 21 n=1 Tax=Aristolochia fimbriata TaxID=158543 RepID=A0AAV7FI17_ARIFI|nr:hypothetical protein H6P81_004455 [Aristolochia fimbriata]
MASKLRAWRNSKKFPVFTNLSLCYSISTAATIQIPLDVFEKNQPNVAQFDDAIRVLRGRPHPDRLASVLDSAHDLNSDLKIFKWASVQKQFRQTAVTYCCMILKLGIVGRMQEMEILLIEMMKIKRLNEEELVFCFSFLVESFCRSQRLDGAVKVFETMNSAKCYPQISTCNLLLGNFVEKKDLERVIFIYKEMVKAGTVPNVETLNCLMEVLCESDHTEIALEQFRRMQQKHLSPNSRSFKIIVVGLLSRNRIAEAIQVLDRMSESCNVTECDFYNSVIPLLCKTNKLEEAIRLYIMMRGAGLLPTLAVYGTMVAACCESHKLNEAIKLMMEMTDMGLTPGIQMYVDVVNEYCQLGKFAEAETFLDAYLISEVSPFNALIEGYYKAGKISEANCLLSKMLERDACNNFSWNFVIKGLCKLGWIDKAQEVLCRMIISSFIPDDATYSALILGFCKTRSLQDALDIYHRVCARNWCLDLDSYSELIDVLCQLNKIQEALEVFQYMSSKGCNLLTSSFNLFIGQICLIGKVDEAIRLKSFAYYNGTVPSPTTYGIIMDSLCKSNRVKSSLVLLAQMLVEGLVFESSVYCALIKGLCADNQTKEASIMFEQMICDGFAPDPETLDTLVMCMVQHSQMHTVRNSLDRTMSKGVAFSSKMYNAVINGLWKEGYRADACKFLDLMLESGWVPDAATHGLLTGHVAIEESRVNELSSWVTFFASLVSCEQSLQMLQMECAKNSEVMETTESISINLGLLRIPRANASLSLVI